MKREVGQAARGRRPRQRTPTVEPGAIIRGRYLLGQEIGRGGLTVVHEATDLVAADADLADSAVALKIVEADRKTDPDTLKLLHREGRRLRELVHANIVRVHDMDSQGRVHFMVMERLEGRSLARVLREAKGNRLSRAQVDRLVADIASALALAHGRGVVHADLKPGNIFIETTGRLKLIDFNIAYPVARAPKTDEEDTLAILGRLGAVTPRYASPQRLAGADPCPADDVFSLAIVTYIALAGRHPFAEKTPAEAAREGLVPEPPEGLDPAYWDALRRAMAFDDAHRTGSVEAFAQDFVRASRPLSVARFFRRNG